MRHHPGYPALEWNWSGRQASYEGSSSYLIQKTLLPPDMLIWAEGATVYVGEDKVNTSFIIYQVLATELQRTCGELHKKCTPADLAEEGQYCRGRE